MLTTATHIAFDPTVAPIRQSNLCMEIALPTAPLDNINDEKGEIALCTLSAINLGKIEKLSDIEEPAELIVRLMRCLIIKDYPVIAAKKAVPIVALWALA